MNGSFLSMPDQASSNAASVDTLFLFILAVAAFFSVLIASLIIFFAIRYRRRSESEVPKPIEGSLRLEILWTVIPLALTMIMFFWGAKVFFANTAPPADAMDIYVVGKQWMWTMQHPEGVREKDELHVPVGRAIRLVMTSEDVIHSFFIPAFRTKQDVLPGRYTVTWFKAEKPGEYHLFCSQYCGTEHSKMTGKIVVMEPGKYAAWLSGAVPDVPMPVAGEQLFRTFGCLSCHGVQGPMLAGLYGREQDVVFGLPGPGTTKRMKVDESYLRRKILSARDFTVQGYSPVMPSFQGAISEDQLMQLIAYIKSLKDFSAMPPPTSAATTPSAPPPFSPGRPQP